MIEIKRNNGSPVKVFAETFEYEAYDQVKTLANYSPYADSTIRIMPDAHAGKGCTIGTTMTLHGAVTPNLVGVDIGCGMRVMKIRKMGETDITEDDYKKLDEVIHKFVPSGFDIHSQAWAKFPELDDLYCINGIDSSRVIKSLGTLGGGNHFIELDRSEGGDVYLVIHSGSRNLGVQVCKFYQDLAFKCLNEMSTAKRALIKKLTAEGRQKDIQKELKLLKKPSASKDLAHLTGENFNSYIHDMEITQRYAVKNRETIARIICDKMNWVAQDEFETIHNYIDADAMILRKGAVRADAGEKLIIPMNMRDGSLICIGKGNPDWNYSAPHGAGRLMSRAKAKDTLSVDEFKNTMSGIYSTTVGKGTIDESPMAYKPMDEIIRCIEPTAEIVDIIKPVYNFKAGE